MRGKDLRHAICGNVRRVTRQNISETRVCWLQTLTCLGIHRTHGKIIVKMSLPTIRKFCTDTN